MRLSVFFMLSLIVALPLVSAIGELINLQDPITININTGGGGGAGNLSAVDPPYLFESSGTVFFNETRLNITIDLRATGTANESFNQTLTDSLYSGIEFGYNFSLNNPADSITLALLNITGNDDNACTGTDKVTNVTFDNGNLILICATDETGTGGNLFDQTLNTTSNVTFESVNATREMFVNEVLVSTFLINQTEDNFFYNQTDTVFFYNQSDGNDGASNLFDQELNTTDNVTFESVNATREMFVNEVVVSSFLYNFSLNNPADSIILALLNITGNDHNACTGTDKVTNVTFDNGNLILTCDTDETGAGGNLFDQDLNTTSNVTFRGLNITNSTGDFSLFIGQDGNVGIRNSSDEHDFFVQGHIGIERSADGLNQHALDIEADGNAFGGFKAIFLDYDTGIIVEGDDAGAIFINIDKFESTGGEVSGIEVVSTEGGANTIAMEVGVQVGVVEQLSGIFADMDSALNNTIDVLTEFLSEASDVDIFVNNGDTVTIGNAEKFQELEFILDTSASGAGIKPNFYFSTGVDTWEQFTPGDGTNGMRDSGVIIWLDQDIPSWVVGTGTEFLIRINRTQNSIATTPIENIVQIASAVEYHWDNNGSLEVNSVNATNNISALFFFGDGSTLSNLPTASNLFDQILNISSNVTFESVNATREIFINEVVVSSFLYNQSIEERIGNCSGDNDCTGIIYNVEIDTFSELDTIVADASLCRLDAAQTFTAEPVFSVGINITIDQNITIGACQETWNGTCLNTYCSATLIQSIGCI